MTRNALITGAGSGIGAATARLLAERGVNIWITYSTNSTGAKETAEACRAHGVQARTSTLDLRDPGSITALTEEVASQWGSLHALINNASTCPYADWTQIAVSEWDTVLETNARGSFLLIRAALPLLRRAEGDRCIVNVASLAGQIGALSTSIHYAASKAALMAISRTFARLLAAEGIRVNAVSPGPIETSITSNLQPEARERLISAIPLRRMGEPSDVAHAICLLASAESAFTTGATYDVNGGLRME